MLGVCYTWFKRGTGLQFKIPTRWSSQGRINLIGTLSLFGVQEKLEVRELSGSCDGQQVVAFLDALATSCTPARMTVVVLDNARFHKGALVMERLVDWERCGLYLRFLPTYSPELNLIEGVWRRVKGFLMPRRCYGSVVELRSAMLVALGTMNTTFI